MAVEALECPTLLENGFGEHTIQGIGDKHIPLIHNVMNTDLVVAVSDRGTDQLYAMFNSVEGLRYLSDRRGVPEPILQTLQHFALSSICNVLAAISTAKTLDLGPDDAIVTVATDGAALYPSEYSKIVARDFAHGFTSLDAAQVWGEHLANVSTAHTIELTEASATASSILATTPGSSSRHTVRTVRGPPLAVVLAGPAPLRAGVGRHDPRVQRASDGQLIVPRPIRPPVFW